MPRDNDPSPQPLIVGLLMAGPAHPYSIYREMNDSLGRVWRIGRANLYARLKRAELDGLVGVETAEQESAPDRNVYRITDKGRKVFLAWLCGSSERVRDIRLEFLARLYFFRRLDLDGLENAIELQKSVLASRIKSLENEIIQAAQSHDDYWRLVLEFRRSEAKAVIEWLDACTMTNRRIV